MLLVGDGGKLLVAPLTLREEASLLVFGGGGRYIMRFLYVVSLAGEVKLLFRYLAFMAISRQIGMWRSADSSLNLRLQCSQRMRSSTGGRPESSSPFDFATRTIRRKFSRLLLQLDLGLSFFSSACWDALVYVLEDSKSHYSALFVLVVHLHIRSLGSHFGNIKHFSRFLHFFARIHMLGLSN